jgi:predicted nucleic acid-binding protein
MSRAFGDAHYFLALLNPRDSHHEGAVMIAQQWRGEIITTRWVLAEVADALCAPPNRPIAVAFIEEVERGGQFRLVEQSDALFRDGFALFSKREDKGWPLTDCISFAVMSSEGLSDALTGDRHFEQAGFHALLLTNP